MNEYMRSYKLLKEILSTISDDTTEYLENDKELPDLVLQYKGIKCSIPLDFASINNNVQDGLYDIALSMEEYLSIDDMEQFSFIDIEPIYTGGNIWVFLGALDNGLFFIASDDYDDFRILNADPRGIEQAFYADWQEDHLVEDVNNNKTAPIFIEIYKWLAAHCSSCDIDFDNEIRKREVKNDNEQ